MISTLSETLYLPLLSESNVEWMHTEDREHIQLATTYINHVDELCLHIYYLGFSNFSKISTIYSVLC